MNFAFDFIQKKKQTTTYRNRWSSIENAQKRVHCKFDTIGLLRAHFMHEIADVTLAINCNAAASRAFDKDPECKRLKFIDNADSFVTNFPDISLCFL